MIKFYEFTYHCFFVFLHIGLSSVGPLGKNVEVDEIENINCGNMFLKAQSPIYPLPWAGNDKFSIGEVLCEPEFINGKSVFVSTRTVARQQLEKLRKEGYQLVSGMEMEFILEDKLSGLLYNREV